MMQYECKIKVRYYETDQMGVVHHSNFIRYIECGRTDMMEHYGFPVEQLESSGIMLPVVAIEGKYKMSAKLGDILRVVTKIDKVPLAKIVFKNEVYNQNGDLLFIGQVSLGFVDMKTHCPVRCPEEMAKAIEKELNKQ